MIKSRQIIVGLGSSKCLLIHSFLLAAICALGLQEPFASSNVEPQTQTIYIKGFKFVPDTLTVNAGDTIVWTNEDKVTHTATAEGKVFDSKNIPYGASWEYVADKRGTHSYFCIPHPTMKGKLIVQ